jgi:Mce-associated membrane protein
VRLGVVAVLLGAFAAFAGIQAGAGGDDEATRNAALTDTARTSELKGNITKAVNAVFSVNYADLGANQDAAGKYLTGAAVGQHRDMLKGVRDKAPKQKLVLTTTVTDSGVERIEGDRARVLVYADQRNTRTDKDETTYAAAMFAVDVVQQGGTWKISDIDTFNR